MTVHQLHRADEAHGEEHEQAHAGLGVEGLHPPRVASAIAAARDGVETAASVAPGVLDRFELGEAVAELSALESQVACLRLRLLAEADARRVAEETGDTGTDAWAARLTGSTRAVMSGGIWLAKLLAERFHATRDAFASGGINEAQVRVIVRAAVRIPAVVTTEQVRLAEEGLVAKAVGGMDARRLRHAARRMLEVIGRDLADEQEKQQLEDEEERAEVETWLTLHDNADGTFSGRFVIPELQAQMLAAALERLSSPRRLARDVTGRLVEDPTLPGSGPGLNWSERLGAAFVELLEHLPADGHGPVGATVMVHLDYQHLLDGLAGARMDTGVRVSAGQARRLACNAQIVPVVLGGDSEVLDQGRARRLHTVAQRRALSVSYDSCSAVGCERPFAWCEIHHPQPWSLGGPTSVENGVPLCGHHHRRAHDERFSWSLTPEGEIRFRRRRGRDAA